MRNINEELKTLKDEKSLVLQGSHLKELYNRKIQELRAEITKLREKKDHPFNDDQVYIRELANLISFKEKILNGFLALKERGFTLNNIEEILEKFPAVKEDKGSFDLFAEYFSGISIGFQQGLGDLAAAIFTLPESKTPPLLIETFRDYLQKLESTLQNWPPEKLSPAEKLSHDLLNKIFSLLNEKDLQKAKLVSKFWYHKISNIHLPGNKHRLLFSLGIDRFLNHYFPIRYEGHEIFFHWVDLWNEEKEEKEVWQGKIVWRNAEICIPGLSYYAEYTDYYYLDGEQKKDLFPGKDREYKKEFMNALLYHYIHQVTAIYKDYDGKSSHRYVEILETEYSKLPFLIDTSTHPMCEYINYINQKVSELRKCAGTVEVTADFYNNITKSMKDQNLIKILLLLRHMMIFGGKQTLTECLEAIQKPDNYWKEYKGNISIQERQEYDKENPTRKMTDKEWNQYFNSLNRTNFFSGYFAGSEFNSCRVDKSFIEFIKDNKEWQQFIIELGALETSKNVSDEQLAKLEV